MKTLEKEITRKGFTYKQVKRTKDVAWYSQYDSEGRLVGNEIFIVRVGKAAEAFGVVFEEHEIYPSELRFGVDAWSVGREENRARAKYEQLIVDVVERKKNNENTI